jgi:cell division protein FtsA
LSGGIILTGGGSSLYGLAEAFERAFNCSVRNGIPNSDKVKGPDEILLNPSYTAGIGAIAYDFLRSKGCVQKSAGNGIVSKILRWFEEAF